MVIPKKIPTLIALCILFLGIGLISFVLQKMTSNQTRTSPLSEPKNLMITNLTDTSGKVVWQTDAASTGMLLLNSKTTGTITVYDERDGAGKPMKYTTHSVLIKNLQSNTTYDFSIISNGKKYPGKDKPYTLQTGPTITNATAAGFEPSYGTVKTYDGKPANGGILVLTLEGSQPVSTLITPSGSWVIPLNFIRTNDLSQYLPAKDLINETITVYYGSDKTESLTDTANDAPVPDMTIGGSYDFRNQLSKGTKQNSLTDASTVKQKSVLGAQALLNARTPLSPKIGGISITAPIQNASLVSNRPLIQGTGIPGKIITITLGITKPLTGKTTVGTNGLWSYTPPTILGSGKQSVTITTIDEHNNTYATTTTFTILKAGSQVLGDATPSATLEPTPTEPEITAEPMPEPGTTIPTVLLLILGVGMIAGGVVLLR